MRVAKIAGLACVSLFLFLSAPLSLIGCGQGVGGGLDGPSTPDLATTAAPDLAAPRDFTVVIDATSPSDLTAAVVDLDQLPDLAPRPDLRRLTDLAHITDLEKEASDLARTPDASVNGCHSNADCGAKQYCSYPKDGCAVIGTCTDDGPCPQFCTVNCGCDGKQYCNSCLANTAGVALSHSGACP